MKEVTGEYFYKAIGKFDAIVKTTGEFPYVSEFRIRHGKLIGLVKNDYKDGIKNHYPIVSKYYTDI